ncbi:MAG: arginine--tRNA ligase [Acidobacteriota bacterium]|nr:arginine--tRNA ligase [Acidobacteriota bacterium]MDQ2979308.1 arginine--tRNA ligase [Acidobacteriota bacterium]
MPSSPSLEELRAGIARALQDTTRSLYGVSLDRIVLERPPKVSLGDLASPVAFDLAKALKKSPRSIAEEIAGAATLPRGVSAMRVEGGGYVNAFFERGALAATLAEAAPAAAPREGKTIVEHTNINPNKAAHIGHLRNAVLGDVLVRTLRFLGGDVEVQNYLDDTGVQVADVVAGLLHLAGVKTEGQARTVITEARLPGAAANPKGFAYVCWDLYAEVGRTYEARPETKAWRSEALHAIEAGDNETAAIAAAVAEAVSSAHLATMGRIGVAYDLLPRESDILKKNFWARAFEMLKGSGAVILETEGKHAGCWVLRLAETEGFAGLEEPDKILVRSNGTVTYTAKDIAYQLWKFGLLGIDFDYVRFPAVWDSGTVRASEVPATIREHTIWRTAHERGETGAPAFGRGARVVNVIDVRQSYPQKVVREGLRVLGFTSEADRSAHFSYEIVALSPRAARELALRFGEEYRLSAEDEKKPYVEMSGRKGLGVKADDLVELLLERSRGEVNRRRAEGGEALEAESDARAIAVGALRYFLLKFGRNKVIAFDFDEALNFEGDTGPYLQYALVRAGNIFRKLSEKGISAGAPEGDWEDDLWSLLLEAASLPEVAERAAESLELSTLARHAFNLAQAFNQFYHRHPILQESDAAVRNRRIAVARVFRREMARTLDLLGIPEPGRM